MLEETKTPRNAVLGVFYAYFRGGLCLPFHHLLSAGGATANILYLILIHIAT